MQPAIDRIMMTYDLLMNRTAAASAEARARVTDYVTTLFEAGEKDMNRLTVCGLTYLRELDGSSDPRSSRSAPASSNIQRVMETMTSTIGLVAREPGVGLGRVGRGGALGIALQKSGGPADRGVNWICCEISRKKSIGRKVAVVVAAIKEMATGVAVADGAIAVVLGRCGRHGHECR
jgi:hypothetical protein